MKVVLTEKPSVARDIARFLDAGEKRKGYFEGSGYRVTWAYGHLVTLKEPGDYDPSLKRWSLAPLPIVPDQFGLKVIPTKIARRQFRTVKRLFRGASELICATDAGREGELIFRYIQKLAGCEEKPFRRLWLNSLTDRAMNQAFADLRDGREFDNLYSAARCRNEADWIVGLNATRSYTLRYGGRGTLWSIGRVQTPVLAMIVGRDDTIERFEPEKFWELFTKYRGIVFKHRGGRQPSLESANGLLEKVRGRPLEIRSIRDTRKRIPPPLLFDLAELQRHMNRRAGISASATLKIAQKLYERKLITYPRTDSRYLPNDMKSTVPRVLSRLGSVKPDAVKPLDLGRLRYTGRIFNDRRVSDHHAIIPTGASPRGLSGRAFKVYDAVVTRFIAAFYPSCEKMNTTVEAMSNGESFRARGVRVIKPGWTVLYPRKKKSGRSKGSSKGNSPQELPEFTRGESGPHDPFVKKGATKPPYHYNDSSLLSAMETCGKDVDDDELREALKERGLGTPATRAQIIETLLERGYISRRGKQLRATDAGRYLIALAGSESLKSPELTGEWEKKLKLMAAGQFSPETFIGEIVDFTRAVVCEDSGRVDSSVLGPCPLCGKEVIRGKREFGCSGWREGCSFVLRREYRELKLDSKHVRELLQNGRLSAPTMIIDEGGMRKVMLLLDSSGRIRDVPAPSGGFGRKKKKASRRRKRRSRGGGKSSSGKGGRELGTCPVCGSAVVESAKAYGCSDWRKGCKFAIWKRIAGKKIQARTAGALLKNGRTSLLKGFKSKKGKKFSARLKIVDGKVEMEFSGKGR